MDTKFIKENFVQFSRIVAATFAAIGSLAITIVTIGSLIFTAPAYAQAVAPTNPDGAPPQSLEQRAVSPEQQVIPPRCVEGHESHGDTVTVSNKCNTAQRVKVLVAFGPDSACTNVAAYRSFKYSYPSFGRFDGLQRC